MWTIALATCLLKDAGVCLHPWSQVLWQLRRLIFPRWTCQVFFFFHHIHRSELGLVRHLLHLVGVPDAVWPWSMSESFWRSWRMQLGKLKEGKKKKEVWLSFTWEHLQEKKKSQNTVRKACVCELLDKTHIYCTPLKSGHSRMTADQPV